MRKRSGRLGGRGAPGSARAAVLNALAALQPLELRPLLELLLEPLGGVFRDPNGAAGAGGEAAAAVAGGPAAKRQRVANGGGGGVWVPGGFDAADAEGLDRCRLVPAPWWSAPMGTRGLDWWLAAVDAAALARQPLRRKQGFLNALEDMLGHLGFRLQPLLPPLLALTLRILEAACAPVAAADAAGAAGGDEGEEQARQRAGAEAAAAAVAAGQDADSVAHARELRSHSLRLLAHVVRRFPFSADYNPLWGPLLAATAPLLPRLAAEAASDKAPPLLELALALASSPGTARVLANLPSLRYRDPDSSDASSAAAPPPGDASEVLSDPAAAAAADAAAEAAGLPGWAAAGEGGRLLGAALGALGARNRSEASRDAALSVVERLLALQPSELLQRALAPWVPQLLAGLKASVEVIVNTPAPRGGRVRARRLCAGPGEPARGSFDFFCLSLAETLC
jgi:U3 small nucleolar RNA-associated protein 20